MMRLKRKTARWLSGIGLSIAAFCIPDAEPKLPLIEQVYREGVLRVATIESPITFRMVDNQPLGVEYELARGFSEHLSVALEIQQYERADHVLLAVLLGDAHLGAAHIPKTTRRAKGFHFSKPYSSVSPMLVYRQGTPKPKNIRDVKDVITIVSGSEHEEALRDSGEQDKQLMWEPIDGINDQQLLQMVQKKDIKYAVVSNKTFQFYRGQFPEVKSAFALKEEDDVAWATSTRFDNSLIQIANEYLDEIRSVGMLKDINERYYGHLQYYNYVGASYFLRHARERLPIYKKHFKSAAEMVGIDWRLLAAVGYQESHWNPNAVSPTGVRGLMMLTKPTAKEMGVTNRSDPIQSIDGGARYLKKIYDRLPDHITGHDRIWQTLASYNAGYGHITDARLITKKLGGNSGVWTDVQQHLPKLQDPKWFNKTQFGYARAARECIIYVRNIRRYYETLTAASDLEKMGQKPINKTLLPKIQGHEGEISR